MAEFLYPRPAEPDHVAPRGSAAYNDAIKNLHKWVAYHLWRGFPMEEVVDKYDDNGNISHDWKQWTGQFEGTESARPMEYAEEAWNYGNFHDLVNREAYTEWPPGSGQYFNDPANDQTGRQWFDKNGDRIFPDEKGPVIDYDSVNSNYGGSIKRYLKEEGDYQQRAQKAKPIDEPAPAEQVPGSISGNANTLDRPKPMASFGMSQPSTISNPTPQLSMSRPAWGGDKTSSNRVSQSKPSGGFASFGAGFSGGFGKPQAQQKRKVFGTWGS